jgi:hypothetical protein
VARQPAERPLQHADKSQIKAFVEGDESVDIDASNVWGRTEVKYVSGIEGGQQGRKRVESVLIRELEPRYNSK